MATNKTVTFHSIFCALLGFAVAVSAQDSGPAPTADGSDTGEFEDIFAEADGGLFDETLFEVSVDDLFGMEVTSVSKQEELLSQAAAAIYVITGEDIKRAGVTTLPDALRLSPGLTVGQLDAHNWAVGSRGFPDAFANKLLVLIDGRTVYDPLFSGVFWDQQSVQLEDLSRIEVIRGPGATLWGANAVNGVINVITKNAKETQGSFVTAGMGNMIDFYGGVRTGFKIGQDTYMRVYAKGEKRDDFALADGTDNYDSWHIARTGFRMDWLPDTGAEFTLQGDLYMGEVKEISTIAVPTPPFSRLTTSENQIDGANILARWTRTLSDTSSIQVQAYFDRVGREGTEFRETLHTFDLEAQHSFQPWEKHQVIYGGGVRVIHDELLNSFTAEYFPDQRTMDQQNLFIQDKIQLIPDTLAFTIGTKLGRNDFSNFEIQPNARLSYTPSENTTWWAAVSRAVRTPSRAEHDSISRRAFIEATQNSVPFPGYLQFSGDNGFDPEVLVAYELGFRHKPTEKLSIDIATYFNHYNHIRNVEQTGFGFGFPQVLEFGVDNNIKGQVFGAELAIQYDLTKDWRLSANYTVARMQLDLKDGSRDRDALLDEGRLPRNQFGIRSDWDFLEDWTLGLGLRYVGNIPTYNIDKYLEMDARLAWRPTENLEIAIIGRNLLDDQHREFGTSFFSAVPAEVQRSVFGLISYSF